MLYLAAILSLAGAPATKKPDAVAVVAAARNIAAPDLCGEIRRKLIELRPAPILRR